MTTETVRTPESTGRARRLVEGLAFVGVWITLGYLLPLDANGYLLLGIPLTVAFQLLVRRRPLRELWARDGTERFRLDRAGIALAVLLAVTPLLTIVDAAVAGSWSMGLWALVGAAGAIPAAWAFRRTRFVTVLKYALLVLVVGAVVLGVNLVLMPRPVGLVGALVIGVISVLQYVPVMFVMEEVAFRGALDAHVQRPGEPGGIATAVLFSAVWGLWHLPITSVPGWPWWLTLVQVVWVSIALGVPMAWAWRRTGTLAVPALAHAVYNGARNALQF